MKKLAPPLILSVLFALAVGVIISRAEPTAPLRTLNSGHHFLPPYPNPRDRFGFDSDKSDPLTNYDVAALNAGWYSDWGASLDPDHPDRLTYVQLIRFKAGSDPHDPDLVTVSPSKATIAQIAAAHPGSLWFMSNEPDSLYQGNPIYPDVYAHVYHEFYTYIKGLDPTALIANGGIVQPTPCRIMYLDIVWDTYLQAYGEPMPVDVWNIHAFILREVYGSWGASTPPGVSRNCAMDYPIRAGDDMDIFRDNLVAFRQWMKDKGEQDKPLIISEYGVLWPEWLKDEDGRGWPPSRVSDFMVQTFDLFLTEVYTDVGYPADDYRLVQAWAWYSLSDDSHYNGYLFRSSTKQISPMGETYADYITALTDTQYADLAAQLWIDLEPLDNVTPTVPYEPLTITLPVAGSVTNLGKLPADALISAPLLGYQAIHSIPARYESDVTPLPLPSLVLTQPGLYDLALTADPAQQIADPRRWNNGVTLTIDVRSDLVISMTRWSIQSPGTLGGRLNVTLTVTNEELLTTPPVSGTLWLSDTHGTLSTPARHFPIPALNSSATVTIVEELALPGPSGALYYLALEADSDQALDEKDESNNRIEAEIDARPDLVISTTTWSVQPPGTSGGVLSVTLPVTNTGPWPTLPASGTLALSNAYGSLLLPVQRFSVPTIGPCDHATIVQESILPAPDEDIYRVSVDVDSDGVLDERDENNNRIEVTVPIVVTTTLQPDVTSPLTSTSGHIVFLFAAGTVTAPTEMRFTPLMPSELPPAPPLGVTAFRLAAYQGGQPISLTLPVTVTWRYTDADVAGLDEDHLDLYRLTESDRWQRVPCPTKQRQPDENRLSTCIQQLGVYIFGQGYARSLPFILGNKGLELVTQPSTPVLTPKVPPGLPLRLPSWAIPSPSP
ncbi:MAG: hypothetical protein SXV54_04900 [Chloroflexota bacterium]|nr:hypothetical protein [Chloroflexota bacterium]